MERLEEADCSVVECTADSAEFWPSHIPRSVDCFQALSWYVDLAALPSKRLIRALAEYCNSEVDRESLMGLCASSKEGKDRYSAELTQQVTGLPGLLRSHVSCVPPLAVLFALLPVHKPRSYSVASSHGTNARHVDLAFTIIGNCTKWMHQVATSGSGNDLVASALRRQLEHWTGESQLAIPIRFHPPTHFRLVVMKMSSAPLIMVGPGTGVAPFRGFCQRIQQQREVDPSCFPETHLFFGCRHRSHDHLFASEFEQYRQNGVLHGLHVAASREDPEKVTYVQHLIEDNWKLIADILLEREGRIFVCGDARSMAPDVEQTIIRVFERAGRQRDDAVALVASLKEKQRYLVDVWA